VNRALAPVGGVAERVERLVIGADFSADGYTTVEQADELARRLELRPGLRLLDLGSGQGWPGVYLAKTTGCQVVLTDLPLAALRIAAARAATEGLNGQCAAVAAGGRQPPVCRRDLRRDRARRRALLTASEARSSAPVQHGSRPPGRAEHVRAGGLGQAVVREPQPPAGAAR
jgi:hypothetical protein